ncbi:2-phosphosulfolactate phosphatase [Chitinophaga terrae (ex Kim and Jung 2007)]|uniref:2-phosphosulfolactate phosphatase n=1 Tax=Chitinophaga terrae (ex Kim and Jung 2007) TaxID=408074 RepID=UPI002781BD33|nr:2-phosphosulfolactate phosphatase [Chitinophaga terrae (ex Kim and Jung 2007)]MDQ0109886.1 2-phosphosulfolactate phosphatase [Chitinophaga terrae (ex Kim and Jung 2007)]
MSENHKPSLEVCLSPALLHLYDVKNSIVVIIDVLRATSTICTALYNGAARVIPVASVEECVNIGRAIGGITAGERDGRIAEGLVHGNSPFEYPREFIENQTLVLTTTNGTKLLHMAKDAIQIITGSFPNISAVCDYLVAQGQNVILGCAAWKDRVNLEDTLFAGAVVNRIKAHFDINCDSAIAAETLYNAAKDDIYTFMKQATHYKRLANFGLEKDIQYCLTPDGANVLPLFKNGELIAG